MRTGCTSKEERKGEAIRRRDGSGFSKTTISSFGEEHLGRNR